MAQGDLTFFHESKALMLDGGWEAADDLKLAICDNTVAPTAATASPALGDFTEVGTAGSYVAGGISIGTWGAFVTQSSGLVTMDSSTNPTWAQNALNDADAYWGVVYNDTDGGNAALCFVDLGGPINMAIGSLTVTWHANGLATISA